MFTPLANSSYQMPAHFGPRYQGAKTSGWYHDVTTMIVSYVTDRELLSRYIPAPFELAETAVVSVAYARNRNVDWLAGHGYNLIAVNAAVNFKGQRDQLAGNYCLVMWENLADPILTGRELQGIPKIYADISDLDIHEGRWRAEASHFGHPIVDLEVAELSTPSAEDITLFQAAQQDKDHPMAWRYLPNVGAGGEALSEFTLFPSQNQLSEIQVGSGQVNWQNLSWEQNPTQFHIVNALAGLPVLDYLPAITTRGSCNLIVADHPSRVLR